MFSNEVLLSSAVRPVSIVPPPARRSTIPDPLHIYQRKKKRHTLKLNHIHSW